MRSWRGLPMPPETPRPGIGAAIAAAEAKARRSLLRNHGGGYAAVNSIELFFDLVFVFAVTQLSHFLLAALTPLRALETLILFGAVWWAWMWTTWATNWVEPDRGPVRLMIGAIMLGSMVMSSAIPTAFAEGGLQFALAYVAIQLGRCLFTAWAMERDAVGYGRNMRRAAVWFAASAPLWLAGALAATSEARIALWLAALALEYTAPLVFLWVPGMGRSKAAEWHVSGSHMAERCGLFIIIALGEGLIITGATYAEATAQPGLNLALLNAFVGSFAMWWLYFDMGARRGARHIETHALPGLVARQAFTYWHIPIIAGIIVLAVGDELVLAHPLEPAHSEFVLVVVGGALLFIGGLAGFKRISSGNPWIPASHLYGMGIAIALGAWGWLAHPPSLWLFASITALFIVIAVWEWVSFHGGWIERLEARDLWLGHAMRRRYDRRRAARLAKAAARQAK
jgi:low temperature requirement protein LtrA